ncbi:hypothetical protein JCM10296v2_005067 [Rhodotorula toruloides]
MAHPTPPTAAADSQPAPALDDHLARGIRALALRKYSDACDSLAQALQASTSRYGDLAPENVESLVLYGKALLGCAIAQSAVLGGPAPGAGPGGGEGANGDAATGAAGPLNGAAGASSSSTPAAAGPSNPNFHFGGDAEDASGDEGEGADLDEDGEGEDGEGAPAGDREDDLESAFQMLDLARTILTTEIGAMEGKEEERRKREEKLAEVHRLLGDVATESEQFDNAVEEYTSSLSLLSRLLPPYDRTLSELHMLTALALEFVPNATSRAVDHAEKAKSVLVSKLAELEGVPEGEREDKVKKEIEDIKGLMGDVDMKIEDLRTIPTAPAPTSTDSALEALLRQSSSAMAQAAASGAVNDLTGLVKRKKKQVPVPGIVEEHVEVGEGKKGGEEENVVVVKPAPGEEAEGKRKAEEGAEDGKETKKVKGRLEVVKADSSDKGSLERALEGAYGLFAARAIAQNEVEQGKTLIDVAKAEGIEHFVYSSLPSIAMVSGGKYTHVAAFENKAEVEQGFYSNLYMPLYARCGDDGTAIFNVEARSTSSSAGSTTVTTSGPMLPVLASPPLPAFTKGPAATAGETYPIEAPSCSLQDIAAQYEAFTGEKATVQATPVERALTGVPEALLPSLTEVFHYVNELGPNSICYGTMKPEQDKSFEDLGVQASSFQAFVERTGFRVAADQK